MAVDGCGQLCKYIIIVFDIIFGGLGIAFLCLGLWLRFGNNTRQIFQIQDFDSSTFVIGVTVMIVLGAVMLVVAIFGDYGACCEKRSSLQVFSFLVAFLAGAEIVIGVLTYMYSDKVGMHMAEFYTSLYALYTVTGDPAIAVTLTFVQKMLHCCGLTGIKAVELACPDPNGFLEHIKMDGCPSTISAIFVSKAPLMLGIFLGTGALLITALICSSTLAKKIHVAAVSPQYIILSSTTSSANPPYPQQTCLPPCPSPLYHEPVAFTTPAAADAPIAQA